MDNTHIPHDKKTLIQTFKPENTIKRSYNEQAYETSQHILPRAWIPTWLALPRP